MIDAAKIEELRGLLAADTSTDWQTIRALAAENEALWRERNEATSCAACGCPYPNADCGHARNAADFFQPAPCRPDTTSAESPNPL